MAHIGEGRAYYLVSAQADAAVALSGGDGRVIVGAPQPWQLVKAGTCWALQARGGAFLGVEGPAARGRALCALCEPYGWDVRPYNHTPAAVRLYVPGTPFCVDLAHDGASAGVPLTLQEAVDARNQSWRLDNA